MKTGDVVTWTLPSGAKAGGFCVFDEVDGHVMVAVTHLPDGTLSDPIMRPLYFVATADLKKV